MSFENKQTNGGRPVYRTVPVGRRPDAAAEAFDSRISV